MIFIIVKHAYCSYFLSCNGDPLDMLREKHPELYWLPRIITIAFALFVNLFALDVFGEEENFWKTAVAFLIHLLPTLLILMILAFAWRREWIASLLFFLAGIGYIIMAWGQFPWSVYVYMAGPLLIVACLFWINWQRRKQLQPNS